MLAKVVFPELIIRTSTGKIIINRTVFVVIAEGYDINIASTSFNFTFPMSV